MKENYLKFFQNNFLLMSFPPVHIFKFRFPSWCIFGLMKPRSRGTMHMGRKREWVTTCTIGCSGFVSLIAFKFILFTGKIDVCSLSDLTITLEFGLFVMESFSLPVLKSISNYTDGLYTLEWLVSLRCNF